MNKKERIKECRRGTSKEVCFDCSEKYSEKEPYVAPMTVHNGICYICEEFKTVAPSRKLFGFYKII